MKFVYSTEVHEVNKKRYRQRFHESVLGSATDHCRFGVYERECTHYLNVDLLDEDSLPKRLTVIPQQAIVFAFVDLL